MTYIRRLAFVLCLAFTLVASSRASEAATISFRATDLADSGDGDLWQYEYALDDVVFAINDGFSVYFEPALYSALTNVTSPVGWDILTLQPDRLLPSAGIYDALALVDGASISDVFALTFIWSGAAGSAPGTQAFTINQYDAGGNLFVRDSGLTSSVAPVPEPMTLLLFGSALAAMAATRMPSTWRTQLAKTWASSSGSRMRG